MNKESIDLSKRAGNIFYLLDQETRDKMRNQILKSKSFDDLPEWAQQIIIDAENSLNS